MIKKIFNKKSFTLIELLIVLSIILIFSGISLAYYFSFKEDVALKNEEKKLISFFDLARKKAYSSDLYDANCQNFQGYQIIINTNSYQLNFLCSGGATTLNSYLLPANMTISQGTGNYNFLPLNQGTNITQNTIIIKNNNNRKCINISVSSLGVVESNESLYSC